MTFTYRSGMCKGPFICTPDGGVTPEIEQFGKCLYATDCLMDTNMRSFLNEVNAVATFIHQMVLCGVSGALRHRRVCSTA